MPRPRLHLSTALVLMLLTAALLFVNFHNPKEVMPPLPDRDKVTVAEFARIELARARLSGQLRHFGWPASAAQEAIRVRHRPNETTVDLIEEIQWHPGGIAINATVALTILAAAAYLLERRARRKV